MKLGSWLKVMFAILVVAGSVGPAMAMEAPTANPVSDIHRDCASSQIKKFDIYSYVNIPQWVFGRGLLGYVNASQFQPGQTVKFGVMNISPRPITFSNTAPWQVVDEVSQPVYTPLSAQTMTTLNPGQKLDWTWQAAEQSALSSPKMPGIQPLYERNYRIEFPGFVSLPVKVVNLDLMIAWNSSAHNCAIDHTIIRNF